MWAKLGIDVGSGEEGMAEYVNIDYDREEFDTDDAILFIIEGKKVWIPVSQIDMDAYDTTVENTVPITEWCAKENGLI